MQLLGTHFYGVHNADAALARDHCCVFCWQLLCLQQQVYSQQYNHSKELYSDSRQVYMTSDDEQEIIHHAAPRSFSIHMPGLTDIAIPTGLTSLSSRAVLVTRCIHLKPSDQLHIYVYQLIIVRW